jgi:hypothetical protein
MGMILGALDLHIISIKVTFSRGDRIMFLPKQIFVASVCSCLAINTVITLPFAFFTPSVQAQSRRIRYVPPTNLGTLKVSVPGITRSAGCPQLACLIGLVPDLVAETAPVPQTIAERPTIYFLIPKVDGQVSFRLFEAETDTDNVTLKRVKRIYLTSFQIKSKAGIMAFKIPDYVQSLKLDQKYIWEFTVDDSALKIVGSMRRVLPNQNLVNQLKKASLPIERAALFAQESLWYETVQTLAEAQQSSYTKPEIVSEWNHLMKSANLDRVIPFSVLKDAVSVDGTSSKSNTSY